MRHEQRLNCFVDDGSEARNGIPTDSGRVPLLAAHLVVRHLAQAPVVAVRNIREGAWVALGERIQLGIEKPESRPALCE